MDNSPIPTPLQAYKYCPKCAGKFECMGDNLLTCADCKYNFFVNAAPAVGVVIVSNQQEVLLVKRKFEPYKGTWDIPGGFMQPYETYEEAQRREAREELGIEIQVGEFLGSMPEVYPYKGVELPFIGFYSRAIIASGTITPKDDVDKAQFFNADELATIQVTYPGLLPFFNKCIASKF